MFRKRCLLTFLLVVFWSGCSKTNDATITTDIQAKMFADPVLKSAPINVATKDGVVTLTGQVQDDAARTAARNIASQTKGVKQVIDSTSIAPQAPPADITTQNVTPAREPAPARERQARGKKHTAEAPVPDAAVPPEPAFEPAPPAVESAQAEPAALPPAPPAPATPPPPPPPQPITVTIPESTIVTVRTIDAIDSSTSSTGQTFRGSLDAPIVVGDQVVVPKGLNVILKLVNASSASHWRGRWRR